MWLLNSNKTGGPDQLLTWNLRITIALGAAKGLAYLHSPEANVIHRDFKTSNILIDSVSRTKFMLNKFH